MEPNQIEAIAQAILEPDLRRQEELRRKREQEAQSLVRRRKVAWFTLAGCAAGALVAAFTHTRLGSGVLYSGLAGSALGWLVVSLRARKQR